jgi:signal transduction histidine kinase
VEDDGPGIEPSDRQIVFETGYSTTEDGTGLGLSIVKEVVESHDWQICVTDGSRGGARFEISGVEIVTE